MRDFVNRDVTQLSQKLYIFYHEEPRKIVHKSFEVRKVSSSSLCDEKNIKPPFQNVLPPLAAVLVTGLNPVLTKIILKIKNSAEEFSSQVCSRDVTLCIPGE